MEKRKKTFTCWKCHQRGFAEGELVGHRCAECRKERRTEAKDGGRFSSYSVEGAGVWKRDKKGSFTGSKWSKRKRKLKTKAAKRALTRTNARRLSNIVDA